VAGLDMADSPGTPFALERGHRPAVRDWSSRALRHRYLTSVRREAVADRGLLRRSRSIGDGAPRCPERSPDAEHFHREAQFAPDANRIVFTRVLTGPRARWSLSENRERQEIPVAGPDPPYVRGGQLFLVTDTAGMANGFDRFMPATLLETRSISVKWTQANVRSWSFDERDPAWSADGTLEGVASFDIDPSGREVAYAKGRGLPLSGRELGTATTGGWVNRPPRWTESCSMPGRTPRHGRTPQVRSGSGPCGGTATPRGSSAQAIESLGFGSIPKARCWRRPAVPPGRFISGT